MSTQNIIDAIDSILGSDISDDQFGNAVLSQAGLRAGTPDDIDEFVLD